MQFVIPAPKTHNSFNFVGLRLTQHMLATCHHHSNRLHNGPVSNYVLVLNFAYCSLVLSLLFLLYTIRLPFQLFSFVSLVKHKRISIKKIAGLPSFAIFLRLIVTANIEKVETAAQQIFCCRTG